MSPSPRPREDEFNPYHYERTDSQRSWSSSNRSNATSPFEASSNDMFAFLTPSWDMPCMHDERTMSFEEATAALKQHKDSTRKAQNRSAQRAYRERQQSRLKEMQATIEDLSSDRNKLRSQIKDLESNLNRVKVDATIRDIKLKRRRTLPDHVPKRMPEVPPTLEKEDSVGWMLKHIYGLEEAEDDLFAVFEVNGRGAQPS
ncbi:hypothetical protein M409DRAFT_22588 [Zasmidium cellare ATCC 36951]|uniref:BZIP domain-containing protein n=1 Tax=Zasmidium cellare ATCC 36951 TaxID=1080233 RepID=A0A6A6CLX5_ZASCE|nr:uncharacterized protein M409DRAFT_22588 [Zasmidium cellare ATCC 36951]KAF2167160.1 hypothetical protein M409DRAFT_22588 [Zasmidium cellare ATCC 36951]